MSLWVMFSLVTELRWFFNCRKHPPVNRASQVTQRDIQSVGTGRVSGSLQLATRTVHNRAAA
jgi:hypothetical protein